MAIFWTDESWTLLDEGGGTAVTFSSFVDIDVKSDGEALSYPIEQGSFANYNKVTRPLEIRVTLAVEGDDSDFEDVLTQLDEYREEAVKLSVSTPSFMYESMTLESFSYRRQYNRGAGLLTVELDLVEVREVSTATTTVSTATANPPATTDGTKTTSKGATTNSSSKNASSEKTSDTGKTQTNESLAHSLWGS